MITNVLLSLITTLVSGIDSLIPSFTLPSFFTGASLLPIGVINFLAASAFMITPIFPSGLLLSFLVAIADLWPFIMAFLVFDWIYNHIPTIAGFGVKS